MEDGGRVNKPKLDVSFFSVWFAMALDLAAASVAFTASSYWYKFHVANLSIGLRPPSLSSNPPGCISLCYQVTLS